MPMVWYHTTRLTSIGGDYAHSLSRARARFGPQSRAAQQRLRIMVGAMLAGFAVLGIRFVALGVLPSAGLGPQPSLVKYQERPKILDRRGEVLAIQIMTRQLAARPRAILQPAKTAANLKQIFPMLDEAALLDSFLSGKRQYFIVRHNLSPEEEETILRLGEPGLILEDRPQRVYPNGAMAGHVVGFVNRDLVGVAGLEYGLDHSTALQTHVRESGLLVSTLDLRIQHIIRMALSEGMQTYSARAAIGVLMDSQNGEILAMVSLPDFDPNTPQAASAQARFNRASLGVYELGSIFKLYTAAMALEHGGVPPNQRFDVSQPLQIGNHFIRDIHQDADILSLEDVIAYSSNIGAVQLGLGVSAHTHWQYLTRFGFTRRPQADIPELATPLLPSQWTPLTRATVSFGHGIAISPLQAVMAVGALVNGGTLYQPQLRLGAPINGTPILSERTSKRMQAIMRSVVSYGSARQADHADYQLIGKTGTAEKASADGYDQDRLLVSFISVFPGLAPRYVLLVMLDEPQGTDATQGFMGAGWNVAPMTRALVGRIAPLLELPPDRSQDQHESEDPAHAS